MALGDVSGAEEDWRGWRHPREQGKVGGISVLPAIVELFNPWRMVTLSRLQFSGVRMVIPIALLSRVLGSDILLWS